MPGWGVSRTGRQRSRRPTRIARLGRILCLLSVISVMSLHAPPAFAFKISPFTADMTPAGPGARLDYLLENESSNPTAVQIGVVRREQAKDGTEALSAADDQFLIFPAQLILLPKEKRTVRVQWLGAVKPEKELAYRIVAEQLPVDLGKSTEPKNNLHMLVRYMTAVYIVPPGIHRNLARDLVVEGAEPGRDKEGRQTMDVTLANRGPAHIHLRNIQLTARSPGDGKTVILSAQRLTGSML